MPDVRNDTRTGVETSEYEVAKNAHFWGTILTVCGLITGVGAQAAPYLSALPAFADNAKWGILAGMVIAIAGQVSKALVSMGYSASRAQVKAAQATVVSDEMLP